MGRMNIRLLESVNVKLSSDHGRGPKEVSMRARLCDSLRSWPMTRLSLPRASHRLQGRLSEIQSKLIYFNCNDSPAIDMLAGPRLSVWFRAADSRPRRCAIRSLSSRRIASSAAVGTVQKFGIWSTELVPFGALVPSLPATRGAAAR